MSELPNLDEMTEQTKRFRADRLDLWKLLQKKRDEYVSAARQHGAFEEAAQAAAALWITKQVDALAMYDSVYAAIEAVAPDSFRDGGAEVGVEVGRGHGRQDRRQLLHPPVQEELDLGVVAVEEQADLVGLGVADEGGAVLHQAAGGRDHQGAQALIVGARQPLGEAREALAVDAREDGQARHQAAAGLRPLVLFHPVAEIITLAQGRPPLRGRTIVARRGGLVRRRTPGDTGGVATDGGMPSC